MPAGEIDAIAAFPDADTENPAARFSDLRRRFAALRLSSPDRAGEIGDGAPRVGIFVLPDNRSPGRLEDLLVESAVEVYPGLHGGANRFIGEINRELLSDEDVIELNKPAGVMKAIVGCVGNILKPGRTLQVSIRSNRWISGSASRPCVCRASALSMISWHLFST